MREAYLTGNTDGAEPTEPAAPFVPMYSFESVTLTDEGRLKLVGMKFFGEGSDEFTITRSRAPHPDLLKELRRLTLHMALLTESVSDELLYPAPAPPPLEPELLAELYPGLLPPTVQSRNALREAVETGEAFLHPLLEPFRCLSVTWKTKGIVLMGERKTRYRFNKNLVLKTPETTIMDGLDEDDMDEGDYPFFGQLRNTLASLQAESIAYINGKYGEGGEQLHLFGKDPEPDAEASSLDKAIDGMFNMVDGLSSKGITLSVGTCKDDMREVKPRKIGKDAAAGND